MKFNYVGVDRVGKRVTGSLEADSENVVRQQMRGLGLRPVSISDAAAGLGFFTQNFDARVGIATLVIFTRQLYTLITSGIPMVQSLEVLTEQTIDKKLKMILVKIKEKVTGGGFLWEAMAGYPKAFPKIYVALIKAGEASGAIDQMLRRLGKYLEDADKLRRQLKSAMMYPIIVVSIGIAVVTAMLVFVIPKFETMLKESGQELPGPTQFVINLSHFFADNILVILGGAALGGFMLFRFMQTNEGRRVMDQITFRLPLFGELAKKGATARFCRTMGTLLQSGVNLLDALDICRAVIDNAVLEESVKGIRSEVENGKTLSFTIGKIPTFPKMAVQMISVGESTGNLDKMLDKVADFYEGEVETMTQGLMKLIEPLVLVFLGGTVGGLLIAMYLPVFKMAG